jgi:hypothetical protein
MSENINIGDDVIVTSGYHEGASGRVVDKRSLSLDMRSPEEYAVVEYPSSHDGSAEQISMPVRRLKRR